MPGAPTYSLERLLKAPAAGYLLATLGVALLCLLMWPVRASIDASNIVMLFLLLVVAISAGYSRGPTVWCAVLGVLSFDFLFVPPYFSLKVSDAQYLLTFFVMLIVGLLTATLTDGLRRQARVAAQREARAAGLYVLARELAGTVSAVQVQERLRAFVAREYAAEAELWQVQADASLQRIEATPEVQLLTPKSHEVPVFVRACAEGATPQELADPYVSGRQLCVLALDGPMRRRGVCLIAMPGGRLDDIVRGELPLLASLVAIAFERLHYVEVAQRVMLEMETEKLRNVILSALSHDIRTPLTVLVGLADTLSRIARDESSQAVELAGAIRDHAMRLSALAHNLLDMARLQAGGVTLRSEWQSIEEIVGAAVAALGPRLAQHRLDIELPAELPLVEFDAVLIERVIVNLLDNAAKYSPPGSRIRLRAWAAAQEMWLEVADAGPGLPADHASWLFQAFERGQAQQPGTGLGLAICRAIVAAHGGRLTAANRTEGRGAVFSLCLPRTEAPQIELEGSPRV